ncbi:MAG TPA: hypothetical protein VJ917_04360, partial [Saprospiraceae bacterium]|nr:hypothetical protein [Saprospiraceae bacterium]
QYNDDAQAGDDISDPLFFFHHFILVRAERRRGWPSNGWRAEKRHIGLSYDIQGTHRIGNNIEGWRQFPHSFFEADACAYTKELRRFESVVFRPLRFWGFLGNTTEMIVENSNTNIEYTNRLGNCETLDAQCSEIFSNGSVTSGSTFDPVTNTWGNLIRPPASMNWCND